MTSKIAHIRVASDADLSEAVDSANKALVKVQIPQTFTSTSITIQGSMDGQNFDDVLNTLQNPLTYTVAAGDVVTVDPVWTAGLTKVKIKTGSSEAADRQIYLGFLDV